MKRILTPLLVAIGLLAAASVPAEAHRGCHRHRTVIIRPTRVIVRPAPIVVKRTVVLSPRVWVAGHWEWRPISGRHVWVPGHWR